MCNKDLTKIATAAAVAGINNMLRIAVNDQSLPNKTAPIHAPNTAPNDQYLTSTPHLLHGIGLDKNAH
jgi:hypothetical protein